MLKSRRKVYRVGGSSCLTIPAPLVKGDEVTLAADRLMLVDLRGEVSEDDLLRLLESLEPRAWRQIERIKKAAATEAVG